MSEISSIQKDIFQAIKEKIPQNLSFVQEVASILELSPDSAYRRIRGEKPLTLEELYKLKDAYNLSVDQFAGESIKTVNFSCSIIDPLNFKVSDWLDKVFFDLHKIYESKEREIIYAAKDPPVFHYFQLPEIAAFKVFFWEKTLFQFPEYEEKKFSYSNIEEETYKKGKAALTMATKIPMIEIWNYNTFRIMLSQIEYYWISGFFHKKDDLLNLLDKTEKWIQHIQKEAEFGFMYLYGSEPEGIENTYQLYSNEVVMNDNNILVKTNYGYSAYITFNVLSLLNTTNQTFCSKMNSYFRGLIKKSNLISHTGAKERNRFFNEQIYALVQLRKNVD